MCCCCFLSVFFHLGFSSEELIGRSWYRLLHPDDLTMSAGLHKSLGEWTETEVMSIFPFTWNVSLYAYLMFFHPTVENDGDAEVQMVVRVQCKDLSWVWMYVRACMEEAKQAIGCRNHIIRWSIFLKPFLLLLLKPRVTVVHVCLQWNRGCLSQRETPQ